MISCFFNKQKKKNYINSFTKGVARALHVQLILVFSKLRPLALIRRRFGWGSKLLQPIQF